VIRPKKRQFFERLRLLYTVPNYESVEDMVLPKPSREQRLKRKQFKISTELSNKQIKRLDRKEFKQGINGTFKEITLYNNDYTLEYYEDVDIFECDSKPFYEPNKNLIIKTLIDEQEYIFENTDKKYNIYANCVIKYTGMRIVENIDEVIEIYNDNNIQNHDINDFWVDDNHFMLKTSIHGEEYYEVAMTLYCNTSVCKHLRSKKLIEDDAKSTYHYFESK